ncbi:MAG: ABC transporter ATP-binding protein [Candidatus Dormibacteraeota bacterium]|uniref:ABC transporter ATP-binding protein n=1 Tax=Candidatus Aeolococcus gillhamiae TaxID=3127015 RepID=A0A934JQS9_9BACT|nr:ABC transporter ATP-binding protein [Candidatus Dormibacteraeota bacterium]
MATTIAERPTPLLRAEGVTAGYGGVPIVRGVSLAVGPGEIVAVIGPNGAGKSTFLKSLVGILRITEGRVKLGDVDVTNRAPEQLARDGVGYVPQVQDIFEPLTVMENLDMGGYLLSAAQIRARVPDVLEVFPQLKPMLKRRADKLSGGERKMLAIARVLMLDPRVLILDEPTANLAPQLADRLLREQIKGLGTLGKAVLLVEQRARAALDIAAWTCVLVSGSTRMEGRSGELLDRQDFEELFLGAATSLTTAGGVEARDS